MQLSYRGIPYTPADPSIEVPESPHVGQFLGRPFAIRRSSMTQPQAQSVRLKYRGTDYTV